MVRVLACVFEQHNLWLVALAALICVSACAGVFYVLDGLYHGATSKGRRRWLFLAALLAGGGTWATHFVAMLGYEPGIPVVYQMGLTLLSAVIGVAGAWAALELNDVWDTPAGRAAAGFVLGASIVALHYVGMSGVQSAAHQVWAVDLVIPSLLGSVLFSIAALHVFKRMRMRYFAASALLLGAIVSLHFTAMGALTLVPDPTVSLPDQALDKNMLAITVATGAAAALLIGVVLALADRRIAANELAMAKHAAELALHDALTGLPNRRCFHDQLEPLLASCGDQKLAIVAIDLDRFKPVNDLYGHAAGDELLVQVARLLREEALEDGLAARLGGDEFVVVMSYEDEDDLMRRLSSLAARFSQPIRLGNNEVSIGATFGVAVVPNDGRDADILLRRADVALYRAKADGRGRFAFFEAGMDVRLRERAALEHDLRSAIRSDEIAPFFQPLVRLETGAVTGYEVLVRWHHPTRGLVQPDQFVPIAIEAGLIDELTFHVLRRACVETLNWEGAPRISLNVAAVQLRDAALPQKILQVLLECGFPPARLEVEVTEDALVGDYDAARAILTSLKNVGIRIALDDFGTGYSSLKHLSELPFDVLKIDRSFVHTMGDSAEAMTIVRTIVQLAKSLGLGVTAEGIETQAQASELQALGCDRGQGYLLGRPASGPKVEERAGEAHRATA
jgi:diguanylate cyclase (GGDEF)-like protein